MRNTRSTPTIAQPLIWLLLALLIAAALWLWLAGDRDAGERPDASRLRIVQGRAATTTRRETPMPATAPDRSAQGAIADVTRAYPMLTDVALDCTGDRCTLTGLIRPVEGQSALDTRQEMLLGGLQTRLGAYGYRMAVPFKMDEIEDNTFRLRASVIRTAV